MRRALAKSLGAVEERFIISVKTDNAGTSADNEFTLPTTGTGYNYDIEYDGQTLTGQTGSVTLTFPSGAGTYNVKISGDFPRCYFNNGGDKAKLLDIKNFGIYALGSTTQENAFRGCLNLAISATDIGYFENVTTFKRSWDGCSSLTSFPVIDTSSCVSFDTVWSGCSSLTSFPLLDTSSGTNFNLTWAGCSSLTSFPLINTSSATNFRFTWAGCSSLTSFPLLDTSIVTGINGAWSNCSSLTSFPQINTSNVSLFSRFGNEGAWGGCSSLTSFPLLDFSNGTDFGGTWYSCSNLTSFPANAFDKNIATNYPNAFFNTNLTTQSIDDILVSLDTSGVSNGTFAQSGGQAPSATGIAAKDSLVAKGWTITYTA